MQTTNLTPTDRLAGIVLDSAGQYLHHLILLQARPNTHLNWEDAMAWAASVGGDLPTPQEQALIFANCRDALSQEWHWSNKAREEGASSAWICNFLYGNQLSNHKSFEGSAVAVRRSILKSFDSSKAFTHHPRAPMVPNAPGTSYQRWFKGDNDSLVVTTDNTQQQWSTCDLSVFRDDTTNAASVGIRMSGQNRAEITASLLPHELRDLATRLLDAAADIEAHPAPRRDFLASVEGVYA